MRSCLRGVAPLMCWQTGLSQVCKFESQTWHQGRITKIMIASLEGFLVGSQPASVGDT